LLQTYRKVALELLGLQSCGVIFWTVCY
jgi:hypothetical protein